MLDSGALRSILRGCRAFAGLIDLGSLVPFGRDALATLFVRSGGMVLLRCDPFRGFVNLITEISPSSGAASCLAASSNLLSRSAILLLRRSGRGFLMQGSRKDAIFVNGASEGPSASTVGLGGGKPNRDPSSDGPSLLGHIAGMPAAAHLSYSPQSVILLPFGSFRQICLPSRVRSGVTGQGLDKGASEGLTA